MSAAPRSATAAAREAALQMLYALELGGQDLGRVERWYIEAHPLAPAVRARAAELLESAVGNRQRIEDLIGRHAHGWKWERISLIDRSLLTLATAELLLPSGAPAGEIVQACTRLGSKFSHPGVINFLRGVLEAVHRELDGAAESEA